MEARDRGISIIHQELSLAPNLSVRDNIFMGREIRTGTGIDFAEEARQTRELMLRLEEDIDHRPRWSPTYGSGSSRSSRSPGPCPSTRGS